MRERKSVRMERLSAYIFHVRIVEVITDQRITEMLHVNTYLMGASSLKAQRYQTVAILIF